MKHALLAIAMLAGCKRDCVHMCQRIETWLDECGYSWEVSFEDEGWSSIEDCYNDHWEADQKKEQGCKIRSADWDRRDCY